MTRPAQLNPYVFVGGCPRSGTTLLQRMLDHHAQMAVVNDAHFIPRVLEMHASQRLAAARKGENIPLNERLVEGTWNYHRFYRMGLDRDDVRQAAEQATTFQAFVGNLFTTVASQYGKSLAGEKTPDYVRHIPLLLGLFPQAKFIHIVRDGRDTALSLLNWATPEKGPGRLAYWDVDPLATAALWWRQFVTCHAEGTPFAGRYVALRYEDLIHSPQEWLDRLCNFLQLPWDASMTHFHEGKATTAPRGSAKQQWLPATKGLRDWRTQMATEEQQLFDLLAGDALQLFDYPSVCDEPVAEVRQRATAALEWWSAEGTKRRNGTGQRLADNSRSSARGPTKRDADREMAARDKALPQLAGLLDPQALPDRIRVCAPHLDVPSDIELRANYVRYKPGTNCLVGYVDSRGNPWGHVVAYGHDTVAKLSKRQHGAERHAVPETSCAFDHERGMVFCRFPYDPALPQLVDFVAGAFFADPKTLAKAPSFGAGACDWRLLSYKPQRRCVVQITQDGQPFAVLRLYRPEDFVSTRETAKMLADSPWYAVQRLGAFERYHAVAMKWVPGHTLDECVNGRDKVRQTTAAGKLLSEVHAAPRAKLRVMMLDDLRRQAMASVSLARKLLPDLADRMDRVLGKVDHQLTRVVPRITLCHGDVHAGQFVIQSDGVQLLDWDFACNGPSGFDLATFAAHAWLAALQDPHGSYTAEQTISAFCEGYQAGIEGSTGPAIPVNFDAYVALNLLRLLPTPFRLRWEQWDHKLEQLLGVAEQHARARGAACAGHPPIEPAEHARPNSMALPVPEERVCRDALDDAQIRAHVLPLVRRSAPEVTEWHWEPAQLIHHKPERRAIAQYTFQGSRRDGNTTRITVLGKLNFKRLELTSYNTQLCLKERLAHSPPHVLQVAAPLGVVPRWNMWLQERLDGTRADRLIRPNEDIDLSARIGEALAALHRTNLRPTSRHSFDRELEILAKCLQRVNFGSPRRIHRLLTNCTRLLSRISEGPLTGIHRDFYPAQVIVDDSIAIIDFDLFSLGSPTVDIGNFIAHLRETAIREFGSPSALAEHESQFVQTYLTHNPTVSTEAIEVLTMVSLARHVEISQRIASRAGSTADLLAHCELLIESMDKVHIH